jgi:hypothetical protein
LVGVSSGEQVVSRIFLSHSSADNRQAVALVEWLKDVRPELATEIFIDIGAETGLRPGQQWQEALRRASDRCEAVICLLSRNWGSSDYCRLEYLLAENLGKQILVARLENLGDTDITSKWQRCDLFAEGAQTDIAVTGGAPVRFNTAALDQLKKAIEGTGVGPEHFAWPPSADPDRVPYRGWEPFEDIDAGVFFGRDAAIVLGTDELRAMRISGLKSLFVVLGPSGSGKSSFLRAGLIPRLQRDDSHFRVLGIVRPERNTLTGAHGLAVAIDTARQALRLAGAPLGEIRSACLNDPNRVVELLRKLRASAATRLAAAGHRGPAPTLVLPLDQAEELFSADAGPEAEQFLVLIADLMRRLNTGSEVGLIVVATIRTDRYEAMQNHSALDGTGTELFSVLKPMPSGHFSQVIMGPAGRASSAGHKLTIAPDLVNRLLEDATGGADTLPLLALTLARLYADYASTGELTLANYEAIGGMRHVVQHAIDEVLATDPDRRAQQLTLLRAAFIPWLATINPDNDQPMRRVARYTDLPEDSRPLIDALVERRLLVRDERDGEVVVEVALESLLRQWDELAGWLRDERNNLIAADDIQRSATAWDAHDRDPAWLLTGSRLSDAEMLAAATVYHDRLVKQPARDYLAASRVAENEKRERYLREQRRFRRWLTAAIAVLAVGMVIAFATSTTINQRQTALTTVLNHTEPLAFAAGRLYTTLSVADAAADTAFIAQAEPRTVRQRYEQAITDAAVAVTRASSGLTDEPLVQKLGKISAELAVYTGLVEIARTNNRAGNPVGSSYMAEASALMQSTILPDAQQLYHETSARVDAETAASTQIPAPPILVVASTVVFGAFAHRRWARGAGRRLNVGVVAGALAILVMVVWVGTVLAISTSGSRSAKDTAAESLKTVTNMSISAQQARADETLSLIRRGTEEVRKHSFYERIDAMHNQLDEYLSRSDAVDKGDLQGADALLAQWRRAEDRINAYISAGNYQAATQVALGTGEDDSTPAFDKLDHALGKAMQQSRNELRNDVLKARRGLSGATLGVVVLSLGAAVAVIAGLWPRMKE